MIKAKSDSHSPKSQCNLFTDNKQKMNRHLYTFFLYLLTPFILAYLGYRALKSADYRGRIGERFGFNKFKISKPVILVHCVSVGETIAATPLINNLLKSQPQFEIVPCDPLRYFFHGDRQIVVLFKIKGQISRKL